MLEQLLRLKSFRVIFVLTLVAMVAIIPFYNRVHFIRAPHVVMEGVFRTLVSGNRGPIICPDTVPTIEVVPGSRLALLEDRPAICDRDVRDFAEDCQTLFHYLMSCYVYYKQAGFGQEPLLNFYINRKFESKISWDKYKKSTVAFLHIEKTGGTSIEKVLRVFSVRNEMIEMQCFACHTIATTMHFQETSNKRLFLRSSRIYGMHHFTRNIRPFLYITWLRHPLARVVSNYYYIKDNPMLRLSQFLIVEYLYPSQNLTDFLNRTENVRIPLMNNFYTRLFLYDGYPDVAMRHEDCCFALKPVETLGEITEEHYLVARRNLKQMGLIGLTEQFSVSQNMATDMLGMARIPEVRLRVTNPYNKSLTEYEESEIRRRNKWDIRLYEDAVQIFNQQLEVYNEFKQVRH